MNQQDKTKKQLIEELIKMNRKVADLESRLQELAREKGALGEVRGQLVSVPQPDLAKVSEQDEMLQQEVARRTLLESQLAQSESFTANLWKRSKMSYGPLIWTLSTRM